MLMSMPAVAQTAQSQGWPGNEPAPAAKPAEAPAKPAASKPQATKDKAVAAAPKPKAAPAPKATEAVAVAAPAPKVEAPKPTPAPEKADAPAAKAEAAKAEAPKADLEQSLRQQSDVLSRLANELQAQRGVIAAQQAQIKALETSAVAAAAPPPPPPPPPLTLHVGDADLLIGGFMDATSITRSTNHGTGIGTSFGTIPFSNTPQGNLSETRFSTQNSRITLQATSKVGKASVKGYIEADFLGNAPANLNVTSNSNTLRMRLYWAQYSQGKIEFLGGQSWSLLTPGRNGISPMPGDLFYSQDVDTNYQMGLTWGRVTQFRVVAHASDTVTAGVSVENPQQYVGSAVVLPAAFPAAEVDATGNTAAPNPYPDVIGKIAFDPKVGKLHQHFDAAVLVRGYKTYNPATSASFSETGTGVSFNTVVEPIKNFRLVATTFMAPGGGRYIANTNGPDFIVNADGSLSFVKARSAIVGAELQAHPKTLVYGYYSQALFDQNVAVDTNGKAIGFGVAGSTSANRELDEATVGVTQTFFKDPRIGGIQLMVQYSNVKRTPFSVPVGTPADARLNMVYVNVRYVLP
jgi:hypothetical protein